MRVSGTEVANELLSLLKEEIAVKKLNPGLGIILAGENPSSRTYVEMKLKTAAQIGIKAEKYEFNNSEQEVALNKIDQLNQDKGVHGIIIQYPVFKGWDFDDLALRVSLDKDVDGFKEGSPFMGATALGVWEMLGAFAKIEGYPSAKDFLTDKKIAILGKGRTAGGPTIRLLRAEGFEPIVIDSKTENSDEIIKSVDVVISATGRRNIINGSNIKIGSYVIGVGVGRDEESGKTFGDINEKEVSEKAKLYCPTIGGIGPLTVACLLKNVVESAKR